jgi:hypothetical protein
MSKLKKRAKKSSQKKNKLGVKNSLVNNINARRRKGKSRPKSKKTVSKDSYKNMQSGWGRKKKKSGRKKPGPKKGSKRRKRGSKKK